MDQTKRKYPRLNLSCDIEFTIDNKTPAPSSNIENSKTKDISIGGMCFITYSELKRGTILNLKFKLKENEAPIEVKGEIMWTEMFEIGGQRGWDNGIAFVDISEEFKDEIMSYIKAKL